MTAIDLTTYMCIEGLVDVAGGEDAFGEAAPDAGRWRTLLASGSRIPKRGQFFLRP